jgi:hypothetical protein
MSNFAGITELTLEQLADATNDINKVGADKLRKSVYQPIVAIATNHAFTDGTSFPDEEDLTMKAAVFMSKTHGSPWVLQRGGLEGVIVEAPASIVSIDDHVAVLFPNHDYSTFE